MDSHILPEYLKVGPLCLPGVIWNIIKEYMPYCHQCYQNISKIHKYFKRHEHINLKHIDSNKNPCLPMYHHMETRLRDNSIAWSYTDNVEIDFDLQFEIDTFVFILSHSHDHYAIGKTNKHRQHNERMPIIYANNTYICTYPMTQNITNNTADMIMNIINKN